ncbi:MAG: hypothetical protein Q8888_01180 [Vigna little leaf phytoplasma]|nr:hypothetical protein [Vigna little leaf phytoplasma]
MIIIIFFPYKLVYAGTTYSVIKKNNSNELTQNLINPYDRKKEILKIKIDAVSEKQQIIEKEFVMLKEKIFTLQMQIKKINKNSAKNVNLLKLRIFHLKQQKNDLKMRLNQLLMERINLEIELKNISKSLN